MSNSPKEDVVWPIARNIVQVGYADVTPEAIEAAKKCVLDTLGVIEAASGITPGLRELVGLVKEAGGKEESTILGFGGRAPAWMAAFANGAMAHCLDYDDTITIGHPSASTIPSSFAIAERLGKVNGRALLTAVALGIDLDCRLYYSISLKFLWHRTPLFGYFGAATAAGKLLRLNVDQMVDALGLAFVQASGTQELRFGVESDIGGMRDGFPNQGGVLAALMAQRGVRGVRTCFEGKAGLFNVYFNGEYKREVLTDRLGQNFRGAEVGLKAFPADGETHNFMECATSLAKEHDIKPDEVASVDIYVGDFTRCLCEPLAGRQRPATTMDAKFSLPFSVAAAIVNRKVTLHTFTPEGIKDEAVLAVAARVRPIIDEGYNRGAGRSPGRVDIKTKDGKVYSKRIDFPYGHPSRPMSWDDIANKFRDCVSHAAKSVPAGNMEKVIKMVRGLENVEDVTEIMRLLA